MSYHLPAEYILELMPFMPSVVQERAIRLFSEYMADDNPHAIFLLKGYAGTGKTTVLRAISEAVKDMGLHVELLATTGRAAKVLKATTGKRATTVHRCIYRATSASVEEGGYFRLDKGQERSLIIVDEASMISNTSSGEASPFGSGHLLDDLLSYVWESDGCKLILVGDEAQLPPVGSELSDALSSEVLQNRYGMRVYEVCLDEVMRQALDSHILGQATYLRQIIDAYRLAKEGEALPFCFNLAGAKDICHLDLSELTDTIERAYRHYGREQVLIVSPSNKRSLMHNMGIRQRVLDYEEPLVRGEQLIVARNNYYYAQRRDKSDFIANGEIIELKSLYRHYHIYDLHFADATVYLPERDDELEVRLLLTGLQDEQAQRSYEQRLQLYNALAYDYKVGSGGSVVDLRRAIRKDPFWGALEVKYGYAITAHKAQGGQWSCVFVDLSLFHYRPADRAMLRWLYTAITRATEQVYLIYTPEYLLG